MNRDHLEDRLNQLGANWPMPSLAKRVTDRIRAEGASPHATEPRRGRWLILGVAASLLVAAIGSWLVLLGSPQTLSAQVQRSLERAGSARLTISVPQEKGERQQAEIWYSKTHGFRVEAAGEVIVDDGRQQWSWRPKDEARQPIVTRRLSRGAAGLIAETLHLDNAPLDWSRHRSPEHDREINGWPCQAYVMTPPMPAAEAQGGAPAHPADPLRIVVWTDAEKRVLRFVDQRQAGGEWKPGREVTIDYDVKVDASKFAVSFPANWQMVDADKALEQRFPLEKSLATHEAGGLLFAIHELVRVEDDMFFVMSSVRGTAEHLKKFPPKPRRLNLQTTILDVADQAASPGTATNNIHRATLTSAESSGVHYMWWLAVRRKFYTVADGKRVPSFDAESIESTPGRIRVPLQAIYRDPRAGRDWITADVEVTLAADGRTESLAEIAARVRRDVLRLRPAWEAFALHGGVKNDQLRLLDPSATSDKDFAKELGQQLEWLRSHDEVSAGSGGMPGGAPSK